MKLTRMFDDTAEDGHMMTPPGMAHWTGTGPDRTTCRQCEFFQQDGRYAAGSPKHAKGQLKPGRCLKYKQLMKVKGAKIKPTLASCKHFSPEDEPPLFIVDKL